MHRDSFLWQPKYLKVFASVLAFQRNRIAHQIVMLSHFPYTTDRSPTPRDMQYRLRDEGNWLLHGPIHSPLVRTSPREIHVGVDA